MCAQTYAMSNKFFRGHPALIKSGSVCGFCLWLWYSNNGVIYGTLKPGSRLGLRKPLACALVHWEEHVLGIDHWYPFIAFRSHGRLVTFIFYYTDAPSPPPLVHSHTYHNKSNQNKKYCGAEEQKKFCTVLVTFTGNCARCVTIWQNWLSVSRNFLWGLYNVRKNYRVCSRIAGV